MLEELLLHLRDPPERIQEYSSDPGSPAEEKLDALQAQLNDPDVAGDHERLHATYEAHREAQQELERLFARWEELERRLLGE